jgi:signal peptidase II
MNQIRSLLRTRTSRIAAFASILLVLDQVSKALVLRFLPRVQVDEWTVIPGFFKLVHFQNTGAAWSVFSGNNKYLAIVAVVALVILFFPRHHFDSRSLTGQTALGLIFGGITGNLIDRIHFGCVIDFLYFYWQRADGEISFPAFNVADSAICTGVGLIFLLSWKNDRAPKPGEPPVTSDQ